MATQLSKNFEHQSAESNWYNHWVDSGYFYSTPDNREPYTVVIPPPNVTGVLHMGHCLNNTIQDILIRRARLQGKNACWVPGTDHASIATEAKVVQMLREKGIAKSSLSREAFLKYAWEWKEKYGGIILQQLKKLGCSLDWNRVNFTMDPDYYEAVISVFVDLYNKGLIYRGKRMINWDPKAKTALSDEEVIFKDTQSKLYHLAYKVTDESGQATADTIVIATVRPETILGDTAVAVHPDDERFKHLHGKYVLVPLINRRIPIITDEYVSMDFGTGALKITPAHDMNDYQLGQKHKLEVVDIMNDDGTFSEEAQLFVGEDRFVVRKKIVPMLEEQGYLVKIEDYPNQVGYSERSDAVVEPRLSMQWWVKMQPLAEPALKVVMEDEIRFFPVKFKNLYRHWMENIKDWCISRQLWWGHRIPAWYDNHGNFFVAKNEAEAKLQAAHKLLLAKGEVITEASLQHAAQSLQLVQDEDCLDTWFSSWLWPFEVFKGYSNPGNDDVKYYYPTATLVTAPEIIFFWVARMIMAGLEYEKQIPFKDVYFTGIVRDEKGRKMSKSLGNSPDLLEMIDRYGSDAVRFGIMISSPAGNDLLFDVKEESTLKQGSFFVNKMWNALKLIKLWEERGIATAEAKSQESFSEINWPNFWFEARLQQGKKEINSLMDQFRLSEALKTVYSLIWDDYCSWYLEWIKPDFGTPINGHHFNSAIRFFEELMQLLHPFMPFVTEEIYHSLKERPTGDDLCIKVAAAENELDLLLPGNTPSGYLQQGELLKQAITAVRDVRNKQQLKPRDEIAIAIETSQPQVYQNIGSIFGKQVNAQISFGTSSKAGSAVVNIESDKFFIHTNQQVDSAVQKAELLKDLEYQQKFLESVSKKLSNERFVQNAKPEVVEFEKKKKADAEARIRTIEESLHSLQ